VPQRLLTDNGIALNPSRRGLVGQLVAHVAALGTEAITGTITVDKVFYEIDVRHASEQVLVITDGDNITVTDLDGEILAEHTRPAPGVTYVGNARPRGPRPKTTQTSPKS